MILHGLHCEFRNQGPTRPGGEVWVRGGGEGEGGKEEEAQEPTAHQRTGGSGAVIGM